MVDISSQNNKINVTVSSSGNTANANVTPDYAQYYSEKSKEWAISNRIVDNTDYSSKYYANESKKQADISTAKATEVIESGNTAVSNIESARDNAILDVNTAGATQVALATEQATIATNKASEVIASGNNALSNIDTAKNNAITTITTQETTSKNNVIATGNEQVARIEATGNNYDNLTHKNITNCLLEVPQRIKLELNDGTLTLKAGSQVIVPNGFEADGTTPKFDEVTLQQDLSVHDTYSYNGNVLAMVNATVISTERIEVTSSGSTPGYHDTYGTWYDTTENIIKRTIDGGATWQGNFAFPIACGSYNNLITSIDQVFNGMGYIGSTIWVDKGVKGLIPNGRNADGSLRNIEFETSRVFTQTATWVDDNIIFSISSSRIGRWGRNDVYYNEYDNFNYFKGSKITDCFIGTFDYSNRITNFQPKLPFRAVDYNDFGEQLSDKLDRSAVKAYITETYVNGTSGYRVWSDGYCEQWGVSPSGADKETVTVTLLKAFKDTNYNVISVQRDGPSGDYTNGIRVINYGTGSFQLNYRTGGTATAYWRACGYLADGEY